MPDYKVIGLMSGSSLDGVDLCYACFTEEGGRWSYRDCIAETIAYPFEWNSRLNGAPSQNGFELSKLHVEYGMYLGSLVKEFIQRNKLHPDLISSHGHTIFHQPKMGLTLQIGDGASVYSVTGIKTVSDLRNVDVALGGQGAPLVPVGERDLFGGYGMFLNLGGIANITAFEPGGRITAYDVTPCNTPLNMLCEKYFNKAFDANGEFALKGKADAELLQHLKRLSFFSQVPPKSLGREFSADHYLPVIEQSGLSPIDKLATAIHHITDEISGSINSGAPRLRSKNVLVSGGGAYNKYMMQLLREKSSVPLEIPEPLIIEFKEALIFGYLGLLRMLGAKNALASVTHASADNIGGALWG
jgi:anhydro-N-acetylmuramic acid kinase